MILKLKMAWRIFNISLFSILITFLFYSCIDDDFDMKKASSSMALDQNMNIPIGNINLDLNDFLKDMDSSVLHKSPDGLFYVVFENDLLSYKGEDNIKIAKQLPFGLPGLIFPPVFPEDSVTRDSTISIPFSVDQNQILDSVLLKSMALSFNGSSNYLNDGLITFTFTTILKEKKPYKISFRIPKSTSGNNVPISFEANPALANGYTMTFTKDNTGSNQLPLHMSYTLYGDKGNALDVSKVLTLEFSINDMKYKTMYGYLGKYSLMDLTDFITTDFLNQDLAKNIEWKNPKVEIILTNGYGIPVRFQIADLFLYPLNSVPENVTPTLPGNPKNIKFPSQLQKYALADTMKLDTLNSKPLFKGLGNAPTKIEYRFTAWCNPDENTSVKNVVYDTSTIKGKFRFELPIHFRTSGLENKDTIEINLFGDDSKSSLKSMKLKIVSFNELPVDMLLQMEFIDANNNVVSTLFDNVAESDRVIIKGGTVDADGNLVKSSEFKKEIVFTETALKGLSKAKKIIYTTRVLSTGYDIKNKTGPYVKFKDGLKLKMSFTCEFQPLIEL